MKQLTILSAILLGATGSAAAQELNSEFTVTHQVVPEERAATRLQMLPQLQLPAVDAGRLPSSGLVTAGPVSPTLTFIQPVPWGSTLAVSPWRGYAQLAYGPAYNLDASAGYRIIDGKNLQLGAFMQFNGFKYSSSAHPDTPWRVYGKPTLRRNSFTAGSALTWRPIENGTLRVAADYTFSAHNIPMPVVKIDEDGMVLPDAENPVTTIYNVNHNGLNISADWAQNVSAKFRYTLSTSYGLTAFSRYTDGCMENRGTIGTSLIYDHGQKSHWQLDLSMLSVEMSDFGHKGVLSVAPLYRLTLRRFIAQLGFKADFLLGNVHNFDDDNGTDGWLYPRLDLCWKPSAMFALWGKFDGRTDANTMASLFEAQPYNFPVNFMPVTYHYVDVENETISTTINEPLGYSAVYTLDAGMTLGPWKGASITIFGGLGFANDWLLPAARTGYWQSRDVSGGHYGFSFDYSWRQYLSINARLERSTAEDGDYNSGYFLWRDHARTDFTAAIGSRPIDPLSIRLAYHLRTGRSKEMPLNGIQNLYNISDFDASASYDLTERWNVSLRAENILNHIYYLGPAIPCHGFRMMAGASYKF